MPNHRLASNRWNVLASSIRAKRHTRVRCNYRGVANYTMITLKRKGYALVFPRVIADVFRISNVSVQWPSSWYKYTQNFLFVKYLGTFFVWLKHLWKAQTTRCIKESLVFSQKIRHSPSKILLFSSSRDKYLFTDFINNHTEYTITYQNNPFFKSQWDSME